MRVSWSGFHAECSTVFWTQNQTAYKSTHTHTAVQSLTIKYCIWYKTNALQRVTCYLRDGRAGQGREALACPLPVAVHAWITIFARCSKTSALPYSIKWMVRQFTGMLKTLCSKQWHSHLQQTAMMKIIHLAHLHYSQFMNCDKGHLHLLFLHILWRAWELNIW